VDWVTPVKALNPKSGPFMTHGNKLSLNMLYVDMCMVVRIGKAGRGLKYA